MSAPARGGGTGRAPRSASIVVISKNEPSLATTLDHLEAQSAALVPGLLAEVEILVVDASAGGTGALEAAHPGVRFVPFEAPAGVRISIPHQRNCGVHEARGEIVVFTDCGCVPAEGWLAALLAPIVAGEEVMAAGRTGASGRIDPYRDLRAAPGGGRYLRECPTINLAFRREVFDEVGGFDETFEYGSDVDFSWRAVHRGFAIRSVPDALVLHDWGSRRRQIRRSYAYGKARARLYAKHVLGRGPQSVRKRRLEEGDAVPLLYPAFLLGLPLARRLRWYPLLVAVPLWRSRRDHPLAALVDHLVLGAGVLAGAVGLLSHRRR